MSTSFVIDIIYSANYMTHYKFSNSRRRSYPLSGGSGTIEGASKKLTAFPKLLNTIAIPVAVVLSPGGNHAEDTAEGAENTIIPAIPFRIAQMCDNLKQIHA